MIGCNFSILCVLLYSSLESIIPPAMPKVVFGATKDEPEGARPSGSFYKILGENVERHAANNQQKQQTRQYNG